MSALLPTEPAVAPYPQSTWAMRQSESPAEKALRRFELRLARRRLRQPVNYEWDHVTQREFVTMPLGRVFAFDDADGSMSELVETPLATERRAA